MKKITTEDFIKRAKQKHGDKYDYSKSVYIGSTKKITVTCPIHGDFEQQAHNHYRSGCKKCFLENKSHTTEMFINKARKVHGDTYDYSLVEYVNSDTKVTILCKIHGEFNQVAGDHTSGAAGCPHCGNERTHQALRSNMNEWMEKARKVHGDTYDYSLVEYVNSKTEVNIICPNHGGFQQTPANHLYAGGCNQCGIDKLRDTKESFIKKANKKHDSFYDYSKADYIDSKTKMTITCPTHGDFQQTPSGHLNFGCHKCSTDRQRNNLEGFLQKAREAHGDRYDYSKAVYKDAFSKVTIICKIHGEFEQEASGHMRGRGCPKCSRNVSNKENRWLDSLGIQSRQCNIKIPGYKKKIKVDGYDPFTNTVYEFHGDFWHGNPDVYKSNDINRVTKTTFGALYKKTLLREQRIRASGYNLVVMWENDYQ